MGFYRNTYVNLATGSELMSSAPFEAELNPWGLSEKRQFTMWDREIVDSDKEGVHTFNNLIEYIENKHGLLVNSISIGNRLIYADFLHPEGDPILSTPLLNVIQQSCQSDQAEEKKIQSDLPKDNFENTNEDSNSNLPAFIDIQVECEDEDGNEAYLPIIRYFLSTRNREKVNSTDKGGWRKMFSEMTSNIL